MIGRFAQDTHSHTSESVTQRLERLRLEHARHLRNISSTPSTSSQSHLPNSTTTSLPSGDHIALLPPERDTWNENPNAQTANNAPRPGPMRPRHWNPPLQPRPNVSGPAAPRSWNTRTTQPAQQPARANPRDPPLHPRVDAMPSSSSAKGKKPGRRRRNRPEDLEYHIEAAYGSEYWYRPSSNPRWTEWRTDAISLTLAPTRDNDISNPFLPFNPVLHGERVPTLFETTLAVLFQLYRQSATVDETPGEEGSLVALMEYFPPHTRRCILRYAAVHRPFDQRDLQRLYTSHDEPASSEAPTDNANGEILISGKDIDGSVLDRLGLSTQTSPEDVQLITPQTIILFQTPHLQKRHLLSFPKTLTTLGLIALPPPSTYKRPSHAEYPIPQCLCPWCTSDYPPAALPVPSSSTTSHGNKPSTLNIPPPLATTTSLLPILCTLPALLPSLVTLDVSYNPWMADEVILTNVKVPASTARGAEKDNGILGRWDLRLWGRLKTLGVRGCLALVSGREVLHDNLHRVEDISIVSSSMPTLVERWERSMFAVGRTVDVVWRINSRNIDVPVSRMEPSS